MHMYRIAQEIMNNIIKHSRASSVNFSISEIKGNIELRIIDNGIGFNKDVVIKKTEGLGLQNILARVDLMKGKIYLATELNKGVDYLIKIPSHDV
jgi:two-component system NarL family sensor kinase